MGTLGIGVVVDTDRRWCSLYTTAERHFVRFEKTPLHSICVFYHVRVPMLEVLPYSREFTFHHVSALMSVLVLDPSDIWLPMLTMLSQMRFCFLCETGARKVQPGFDTGRQRREA